LVQGLFDFIVTNDTPSRIIGDKAYDSDPLDATLAARNIELIAPHRSNRHETTQDGRALRRYKRRWRPGSEATTKRCSSLSTKALGIMKRCSSVCVSGCGEGRARSASWCWMTPACPSRVGIPLAWPVSIVVRWARSPTAKAS
jgi:hypothetical protein